MTKPFSPEELLARIRVALRRVFSSDEPLGGRMLLSEPWIGYRFASEPSDH